MAGADSGAELTAPLSSGWIKKTLSNRRNDLKDKDSCDFSAALAFQEINARSQIITTPLKTLHR
jgi:hypothetical protein